MTDPSFVPGWLTEQTQVGYACTLRFHGLIL